MRSITITLVLLVLAGVANADDKELARQSYSEGVRQYEIGDFKAALAAFKKAYLAYEDPAFLFNIAQCERQIGDKAEALRTYRVYLHKVPDSPQRGAVEKIVADLQAALDQEKAATNRPPTGTIQPTPGLHNEAATTAPPGNGAAPANATAPASVTATPANATTTPANSLTASAPERSQPVYKKWWLWTAVGAVVVAGVAVGLGVGLTHSSASGNTFPSVSY